jgi:hypothetical protein
MIKYLISKWTLALLGTIVLGAIGSGVWDVVFKPFFSWIAEILLNVATLGLAAIRDEMYVEIAKGTYERAGVALLSMFSGMVFAFFVAITLSLLIFSRMPPSDVKSAFLKSNNRQNLTFVFTLFCGLVAGFILISNIRMIYIVRAANHIGQLQRVIAPFIDGEQRLSIASRVAQISSRNDYEMIINELTSIARKNNVRIPTFDIY